MHRSATVCSDASEVLVAEEQVAANYSQSTSHGCVQPPLVIDARPVILVSGHQMMPGAAAAATAAVSAASVLVIQHPLPLSVDCSAKLHTSRDISKSTSYTQHKRKRRRKNKVRC